MTSLIAASGSLYVTLVQRGPFPKYLCGHTYELVFQAGPYLSRRKPAVSAHVAGTVSPTMGTPVMATGADTPVANVLRAYLTTICQIPLSVQFAPPPIMQYEEEWSTSEPGRAG